MALTDADRRFVTFVLALVATAWLGLLLVSQSHYRAYLGHELLADADMTIFGLLLGGWLLMTIAMMLPAAVPFLVGFRAVAKRRPDLPLLTALAIAGYLGAWLLVGSGVQAADMVLHQLEGAGLLGDRAEWLLPAGVLALAGLYQLTPLKAARQDRLVAAPDLAVGRWCVHVPLWEAVRIGFHHGGVCAACCWPLMLPLFAIGHGNIIAMALVGSVMAAETLTDWGRELRVPIGIGLLTGSLTLLIV